MLTTPHSLLVQFPDTANHFNVALYGNVLLAAAIAYTLFRRREFPTDDAAFELVRPVLPLPRPFRSLR